MATRTKPGLHRVELPRAPTPSALSARDGLAAARERARCFLPDLVDLMAAIALAPDAEASLHTRLLAGREVRELAFGLPPAVPEAPQPDDARDGRYHCERNASSPAAARVAPPRVSDTARTDRIIGEAPGPRTDIFYLAGEPTALADCCDPSTAARRSSWLAGYPGIAQWRAGGLSGVEKPPRFAEPAAAVGRLGDHGCGWRVVFGAQSSRRADGALPRGREPRPLEAAVAAGGLGRSVPGLGATVADASRSCARTASGTQALAGAAARAGDRSVSGAASPGSHPQTGQARRRPRRYAAPIRHKTARKILLMRHDEQEAAA